MIASRRKPSGDRRRTISAPLISIRVVILFNFQLPIFKEQEMLEIHVRIGGGSRIRTGDILLAKQTLYQLSYTPTEVFGGSRWNRTIDLVLIRDAL